MQAYKNQILLTANEHYTPSPLSILYLIPSASLSPAWEERKSIQVEFIFGLQEVCKQRLLSHQNAQ